MNPSTGTGMSFSTLRRRRKEKLAEACNRLSVSKGVFGVMVTTENWNVINSTFDHHLTFYWKRQMRFVEELGLAAVRDADPQNELAKDHRVLVVFSSNNKDPLKGCVQKIKQIKKNQKELKMAGKRLRMVMDPCQPHTKMIGGKEKVHITEKVSGTVIDQKEDINNVFT